MKELKELQDKKEELTDQELAQVHAGFSGHVDRWHGVIGANYYVVSDLHSEWWFYGKLEESYEQNACFGTTSRVHYFLVLDQGTTPTSELCSDGKHISPSGANWTMYTSKD